MTPLSTQAIVIPMFTYALSRVFNVIEILSRDIPYVITLKEVAINPVDYVERLSEYA